MGKSSLLVRTLNAALEAGKRCTLIDFQMLGQDTLRSGAVFLKRLAGSVADQTATAAQHRAVLGCRLILLPELHQLHREPSSAALGRSVRARHRRGRHPFQADFLYDFFGMLRSWHNARANPMKKKTWKILDLVLVTSTEPYLFIERDHESPFNVGETLTLSDFLSGKSMS